MLIVDKITQKALTDHWHIWDSYNAIPISHFIYIALQKRRQGKNQCLHSQKDIPYLALQVSYVMDIESILDEIDRLITALHCMTQWCHGSSNGLQSDSIKSLPKPMLTWHLFL